MMKCNDLNKSVETKTQTAANYRESLHTIIWSILLGNLCHSLKTKLLLTYEQESLCMRRRDYIFS